MTCTQDFNVENKDTDQATQMGRPIKVFMRFLQFYTFMHT